MLLTFTEVPLNLMLFIFIFPRIPFGILSVSSVPCHFSSDKGLYIISSLHGNCFFVFNAEIGTLKEIMSPAAELHSMELCNVSADTWKLLDITEGATATTVANEMDPFALYWMSKNVTEETPHSSACLVLHDNLRRPEQHTVEVANATSDTILYLVIPCSGEHPSILMRVKLVSIPDNSEQSEDPLERLAFTVLDEVPLTWACRTMGMAYNYARQEITVISEHKDVSVYSHRTGRLLSACSATIEQSNICASSATANIDTINTEVAHDSHTVELECPISATPTPATTAPGPIPRLLDYHNAVVYIIHKPVGCLSSARDYEDAPRGTVYEFAARAGFPHVGLVGRLDGDTSGIMVFTNDGRLNDRILRPPAEPVNPVPNTLLIDGSGGDVLAEAPSAVQTITMTDSTSVCSAFTAAAEADRANTYLALKEKEYLLTLLQGRNKYCMENGVFNTQQFEEEFGLPLVFNRCNAEFNVREAAIKVIRRFQDARFNKHDRADQGWVIEVQVNISEGKHKQIRRLAKRAGYHVVGLKRTKICGGLLCVDSVPAPGDCRWLSAAEKFALYKGFKLI